MLAPNLAVAVGERAPIPVALPVIARDGTVALDAEAWDAIEQLAGMLASVAPVPWIGELAAALGWTRYPGEEGPRLSLAAARDRPRRSDPAVAERACDRGE